MSTHCIIIEVPETGPARGIYCHCDGMPERAGRLLERCYDTPEKVSALIDIGDIDGLGETPGECCEGDATPPRTDGDWRCIDDLINIRVHSIYAYSHRRRAWFVVPQFSELMLPLAGAVMSGDLR